MAWTPGGGVKWWLMVPMSMLLSVVIFEQNLGTQEQVIQLVCEEEQRHRSIDCDDKDIASLASNWIRFIQMAVGFGSLLMVGIAGSVSDHLGRRPVLFVAIIGIFFVTVPNLLVEVVPALRSAWRPLFIACSAVGGLCGGYSMILLSMFAFVADSAPPTSRSKAFTVIEACIGMGGVVGDLAGGYCMDALGARGVFIFLIGIAAFLVFYVLVLLPESLPRERRSAKIDWRMLNCFFALSVFLLSLIHI